MLASHGEIKIWASKPGLQQDLNSVLYLNKHMSLKYEIKNERSIGSKETELKGFCQFKEKLHNE